MIIELGKNQPQFLFLPQMKKRTIERKSKDGFLNSMAKNLGLKSKEEPKAETVREFDDLIETLRTGEISSMDYATEFHFSLSYAFRRRLSRKREVQEIA